MKTTVKFAAILLILVIGFYSCKEEDEGNVPYAHCSCDDKPLAEMNFPLGEAHLFKDFIPENMNLQIRKELNENNGTVIWIIYDSKTDKASLTVGEGVLQNICEICNYPDFAKNWSIPPNGCKVYFEGITYQPCVFKGGIATISYYDYILTKLKRK
jgi:hypothetical protein